MSAEKLLEKNESHSIIVNQHQGKVHSFKTREQAIEFLKGLHEQGKTGEIIITSRTYERIRLEGWIEFWK